MYYLKCDSDGCDYRGDEPDYGAHLIGKPCPVCGANLLTQDDFEKAEPVRAMIQMLVKAGLAFDPSADISHLKDPVQIRVNSHKGKTIIKTEAAIKGNE